MELVSTQTPSSLVFGTALMPNKQQLRLSSVWEFESCRVIQIQQENHCVWANQKSILFWGKLKQDLGLHGESIQSVFIQKCFHPKVFLYCP